jgi:hypothetical protein
MGSTNSKSTIEDSVKDSINSASSIKQAGLGGASCNQTVNIGPNCNAGPITQDCTNKVSVNLTQKGKLKSVTVQDLAQDLTAKSEAKGQNVSLNPGSTKAMSSIASMIELTTNVNNSISQSAAAKAFSSQNVNCFGDKDGNIPSGTGPSGTGPIIQKADLTAVVDSAQEAAIDSDASSDLQQKMSASSKAVTENALTSVLLAIAAIIAVIVIGPEVGLAVLGTKLIPIVVVVGVIAVCGYGFYSCTTEKWPCYRQCLFAPPNGLSRWLSPFAKSYSIVDNPCCANCVNTTTNKGDLRYCAKDNNGKKLLNEQCKTKDGVSCTSTDKDDINTCEENAKNLHDSCKWSGGQGKCKTGMNKGFVGMMVATLVISLFGAAIYASMHKSKKDGATQK